MKSSPWIELFLTTQKKRGQPGWAKNHPKQGLLENRPDGARVDLTEAHPLKLPTIMGSGVLQKWKRTEKKKVPLDII